ncbi:MAG TPA: SDR family oxidoreductase [Gemmataceae bacterium]|nr:SDR family oxidoreductase [Gemmataceae bacterium]
MPVALVTGTGRRRVGWYVADALAARGYSVAWHYHTAAADVEEAVARWRSRSVEGITLQADLADESAARNLVRTVVQQFGRLDVLVNCAAIWRRRRFEDTTAADVTAHFRANVLGTFVCAQEAGLAMVRQPEGGCIINFGDWAEARPYLDFAAYFATKGGIPALTRCLAVELGTRNPRVRVNCILPGPVLWAPDLPEAERREAIRATLVQREGRPENVAQAVLALIENDFIRGASLPVDGGRTIFAGDASV